MKNIWLMGIPCSGKTTIANELKKIYTQYVLLYGDVVRKDKNKDLGFSKRDRIENIKRVVEMCKEYNNINTFVIASFITPLEEMQKIIKKELNCILIYCDCTLEEAERRDVKGMYKKARAGEIKNFTGIDDVFVIPNADLIINTEKSIENCVEKIVNYLKELI